jgi:membrane protein implicated in regulation of membrane protease activity
MSTEVWLTVGILLLLFEIFLPSFTFFWFGLGALLTAAIVWLNFGLAAYMEILIWALFSSLITVLWFRWVSPLLKNKTNAGLSKEAVIGKIGRIVSYDSKKNTGTVRFTIPVLGSDEWKCASHDVINLGNLVEVSDVNGNVFLVTRKDK